VPDRPRFNRRADGAPSYARGAKWPAWALLAIPFLLVILLLNKVAGSRVRWTACWLTVLLFEAVMIPVEHKAILLGHWVYNENRILGPLFWGIPIEEPLIYYIFPPVFVILAYETINGLLSGSVKFDWRSDIERGLKMLGWTPPASAARRAK